VYINIKCLTLTFNKTEHKFIST